MDDSDPREQIQTLEDRIEELAEIIEGCRKVIVVSKAAVFLGALLTLAMMLGAIGFDPIVMIAAITAVRPISCLLVNHVANGKANAAAMEPTETYRVVRNKIIKIARMMSNAQGTNAMSTPAEVAMPLPPLK